MALLKGWLVWMVLAAVGGEAAESGKRVAAAESRVDKPAAAAVSSGGGRVYFTQLTSGAPFPFTLPAVTQPTLFVGDGAFRIAVPSGATRLTVALVTTTPGVDVDLYVRLGQDPTVSGGSVVADYRSEGPTGNETITVTPSSSPPLQAGDYRISLLLFTTGAATSGTLTATVDTGGGTPPPPSGGQQLTSGAPASFSFAAVTAPTLFFGANSFRVDVPAGATQLRVDLVTTTPGVDLDLFVRFGQDTAVSGGSVVADYRSEGLTGNETITITSGSSPPLQAGTYFISLAVFTTGVATAGTVTETVAGGGGADLTGTWSWSASCSGSLVSGQFRITTQQANGAFTGDFLNTNSNDSGTINDGFINGSQVGFRRTIPGGAVQLWSGTLGSTLTGLRLDGTISQGGSLICTFSATRSGGGGSTGCGTGPTAAGPNLIQNGSFENGTTPWTFTDVDFWTGWTCWGARTDTTPPTLRAGAVCIDVNGGGPGVISQTFSTTSGATYVVTFQMAGNPEGGPALRRLRATAGPTSQEFEFDVTGKTGSNMGFCEKSFSFVANSSTTTLEFRSLLSSGPYGPVVDDVRVQGPASGGGGGGGASGPNLLQNPGAEANTGANVECTGISNIPGWTRTGDPTVCRYGTEPPLPGPASVFGANYFAGGNTGQTSLSQVVDVSGLGSQIDAGTLPYTLSGWLGGWRSQNDSVTLRARFRNASTTVLSTANVSLVLAADRGGQSSLLFRSTNGNVPVGTRSIEVVAEFNRTEGSFNDGYADNLSLMLGTGSGGGGGGGGGTPVLAVAPSLDFGSVALGQSRDVNLTVRNTGTAALNVTGLSSTNPTEFIVLGPATPFSVAAGGQQDVMLRFRPAASGARSGALNLATNDPSRSSFGVLLSGTGASAGGGGSFGISASSLSFTATPGTNPASQNFTLSNTGTANINFRITSNQTWLSASPSTGLLGPSPVVVAALVNVAGLSAGSYTGELRVSDALVAASVPGSVGQASPVTITVRLTIQAGGGGGGGSCPPGPAATPSITAGAVVNAASFVSSALPGGAIARGAIFSMFGQNMGPTQLQVATRFPLETTLGCVSIRVTLGSTSVDAIPLAVIATQINAIMPSNAPLGDATITVTWNGRTSGSQRVKIVESSFGFFTANQNGMGPAIAQNFESQSSAPLNSPRRPLRRGQRGVAYGSGLGGITTPDNQPAPGGAPRVTVELTLGGKPAVVEYAGRTPGFAGLDQINFVVADNTPLGCYVPLSGRIGGVVTNTVTVAVSDDPSRCSDPSNPLGTLTTSGGKVGSIQMIRLNAKLQLDATTNFTNIDADVGTAIFVETPAGGEFTYNPITALPPLGSCTVFSAGGVDLSGLLGGQLPGNTPSAGRILDAGPALQVTGPRGAKPLPRSTDLSGLYFNVLGGAVPLLGPPPAPLYLEAGDYTVTGPGGPDVRAFTARFQVPPSFTWSNRDALIQSTRSNGVTFNWSGGDPSTQGITILGGNLDQTSGAGAAFVCFSDFRPGTFAVPSSITQALPLSNLQRPDQTIGFLAIGAGPAGNLPAFTAGGLDQGYAFFAQFSVLSVVWR